MLQLILKYRIMMWVTIKASTVGGFWGFVLVFTGCIQNQGSLSVGFPWGRFGV